MQKSSESDIFLLVASDQIDEDRLFVTVSQVTLLRSEASCNKQYLLVSLYTGTAALRRSFLGQI